MFGLIVCTKLMFRPCEKRERVGDHELLPPTMRSSEGLIDDTSFVPADTEPLDGFTFLSVSFLDDPFLDYI